MRYIHIQKEWDRDAQVNKISLQLIDERTGHVETLVAKQFQPPLTQEEADKISLKKFVDSIKLQRKSATQTVGQGPR